MNKIIVAAAIILSVFAIGAVACAPAQPCQPGQQQPIDD